MRPFRSKFFLVFSSCLFLANLILWILSYALFLWYGSPFVTTSQSPLTMRRHIVSAVEGEYKFIDHEEVYFKPEAEWSASDMRLVSDETKTFFQLPGVEVSQTTSASRVMRGQHTGVAVNASLLAFLTGVVPIVHGWKYARRVLRKRQRRQAGKCPGCAYDLRAHQPGEKCPECGTVVQQKL